ncbi:Na(+)/H(+) exchange regulatory cofactor NHE-RF1-like [Oncorhynchus nerka]|uniref:Na(+)/H(+) exchange regulatory cofactor NHE-RF1-like n=1 Tax=Oncorhynchus nerka TaxID=8023 RepID=UPI0011312030|nr:Na(+)/H(+) exchange regulatory cofactor NHE-RF1-like [Oncorhynchus nerka]XP_035619462.1 Na(+)/H(+) exchange regulatory cofactor NHE-RF1-like [Oncorhynchus keta]
MPSKSEDNRPRLCLLEKGDNGYGFHLHGEKGKTGQFIRLVEPDSPSETSGIRAGDRLVFVNGENVESESHQQVVSRIRATVGQLELIVVDQDTEQLLKKHKMKCLKEYVTERIPLPSDDESESEDVKENGTPCGTPRESTPIPENNGELHGHVELHSHVEKKLSINSEKDVQSELRPRLCVIKKGPHGYGFNLHSEKARPGQYIRAVDEDSPAQRSGLLAKDMIVQVNGMTVKGKQHSEVVAAIKSGGEETSLLVVDTDTDAFFRRCKVAPTPEHLTGSLPEPVVNGDMEKTVNGNGKLVKEVEQDSKLSISPSPSNTSSNASLTTPPTELSEPVIMGAIPGLNLSLQQVKERAHQKRSNKRAPPMDWSKKNELFSNL